MAATTIFRFIDGHVAPSPAAYKELDAVERMFANDARSTNEKGFPPLAYALATASEAISEMNKKHAEAVRCHAEKTSALVDALLRAYPRESFVNDKGTEENERSALMYAADAGLGDCVRALLRREADIDAVDAASWTALMYGAYSGHLDVVDALLKHGADASKINDDGESALSYAISKGHDGVIERLLAGNTTALDDDAGPMSLLAAVRAKRLHLLQRLLDDDAEAFKEWVEDVGDEALLEASRKGYVSIVKLLLAAGADAKNPLLDGLSFFEVAKRAGHTGEILELLSVEESDSKRRKV